MQGNQLSPAEGGAELYAQKIIFQRENSDDSQSLNESQQMIKAHMRLEIASQRISSSKGISRAEEQKLLSGEENLLKEDINVVLEHKASERAMRQGTALSSKHAAKGLKVYEDNDINSPRAQTANSQIEKLDQEEAARIL